MSRTKRRRRRKRRARRSGGRHTKKRRIPQKGGSYAKLVPDDECQEQLDACRVEIGRLQAFVAARAREARRDAASLRATQELLGRVRGWIISPTSTTSESRSIWQRIDNLVRRLTAMGYPAAVVPGLDAAPAPTT